MKGCAHENGWRRARDPLADPRPFNAHSNIRLRIQIQTLIGPHSGPDASGFTTGRPGMGNGDHARLEPMVIRQHGRVALPIARRRPAPGAPPSAGEAGVGARQSEQGVSGSPSSPRGGAPSIPLLSLLSRGAVVNVHSAASAFDEIAAQAPTQSFSDTAAGGLPPRASTGCDKSDICDQSRSELSLWSLLSRAAVVNARWAESPSAPISDPGASKLARRPRDITI